MYVFSCVCWHAFSRVIWAIINFTTVLKQPTNSSSILAWKFYRLEILKFIPLIRIYNIYYLHTQHIFENSEKGDDFLLAVLCLHAVWGWLGWEDEKQWNTAKSHQYLWGSGQPAKCPNWSDKTEFETTSRQAAISW